jgi:phosphoserine phosphatase RsbU/P
MIGTRHIKRIISKVLVIAVIIFCGFFLLLLGKGAYNELYKKNSNTELFQLRISGLVREMSRLIGFAQKMPQDLAYIMEVQKVTSKEMNILLESVLFNNPELFGSAIAYEPNQFDKDSLYFSNYICRSGDSILHTNLNGSEYNYFYKDWYLVPKTLMKPTWSEPYYDDGGGNKLMSTYSIPFFKFNGTKEVFKGIVTVDVSVDMLTKIVQSTAKLWNCQAFLISENGTVLSAPNKNWIFNETIFTLASEMNLPVLREIGKDLQNGESGKKQLAEFQNQKDWWVFYSSIKINKWGVIVMIRKDELYKINFTGKNKLL